MVFTLGQESLLQHCETNSQDDPLQIRAMEQMIAGGTGFLSRDRFTAGETDFCVATLTSRADNAPKAVDICGKLRLKRKVE